MPHGLRFDVFLLRFAVLGRGCGASETSASPQGYRGRYAPYG